MKKHLGIRLLSIALVTVLLCGYTAPLASASSGGDSVDLRFTPLEENDQESSVMAEAVAEEIEETPDYADTDMVRVSIVLDGQSTLEAGYPAQDIAENRSAMTFRAKVRSRQETVISHISQEALGGKELDVVWNITLAANIISANVPFGALEDISAVDGVSSVVLERRYEPCVVDREEADDPHMATSTGMTGANAAWAAGYTGAGSRIAVIDTGTDTDHQSFSDEGFAYALAQQAQTEGKELDAYLEELDLLDVEEIADKLSQLNIAATMDGKNFEVSRLYLTSKLPFAFNYVDKSLDVVHDNDSAGEHGSHVAGIALANRYIPSGNGTFQNALESVKTQGAAPDAQLITMKVFGKMGGAYESDYMVAIEDAIILGCDAVNLSLGSGSPGWSRNGDDVYQAILEGLADSGIVATMSAGNSGTWMENSYSPTGYLYADDVSMTTTGTPGTSANSLSVASVDNAGYTGMYIKSGESIIFYTESASYSNEPIHTLVGERDYVLIDGYGTEEDFAALGDALRGKIAICSRGGSVSFYVKANNAVKAGAIGVIVYNNTTGTINMDLSDYEYTAPCVSITQADGALLKANATAVNGHYEGTFTISDEIASVAYEQAHYTMSDFSSWGVPGSLTIKPEITAPGGSIYSINGAASGGQAYETMSGTSMAAPQVAGMVALAAEYIRETGLEARTGLTSRQLIQSLLMSTSVPLIEEASGSYWSLLKQGSGLANISALLSADSFITMGADATDSYADGKVKAELGDDPGRTGAYRFTFALHNMEETAQRYVFSSDFFTQDLFTQDGISYLDTATTALGASVRYTVDGVTYVPSAARVICDLDGDGDTDADDAQFILESVVDPSVSVAPEGDVDGDGAVTTYDAYLILRDLETGSVLVEAGESVEVAVEIVLPKAVKAQLDAAYPSGAYVEGYVFAAPVSTDEGTVAATHSIPVLGFYGSWTDASMYDRITYTDYLYGDTTASYLGFTQTNTLLIKHQRDSKTYLHTINPYLIEDTYPEGRGAIRSTDTLYQYRLSLIRNAAAITVRISDQNQKELYTGTVFQQANSAYYYTNGGQWMDTASSYTMNRKVSSLGAEEGDVLTVSVIAIPEYYEDGGAISEEDVEQLVASGALGEGAYLTTTLTVDNTAPVMTNISKDLETGNLTVTAQDNNYVAAVRVLNSAGATVLATAAAQQDAAGGEATAVVDLTNSKIGPTCKVLVADYAGNETVYTVDYGGEPEDYTGRMYGFTSSTYRGGGDRWLEIQPEKLCYSSDTACDGTVNLDAMDVLVTAAEYVDGYVYMAADDGMLYAAKQGEWGYISPVGPLQEGAVVKDMAFNYQNNTLYALDNANGIYTVDLVTGEMLPAFTVTVVNPKVTSASNAKYEVLANLAIDDAGNFYAVTVGNYTYYSFLYKWSLADVAGGTAELVPVLGADDKNGHTGYYTGFGALAWDHDSDQLYWATATDQANRFKTGQSNRLLRIDTETGAAEKVNPDYCLGKYPNIECSQFYVGITGLYIVPSGSGEIAPAEEATKITISEESLDLLQGSAYALSATVFPWTLSDSSVTWTTDNPAVATVEDGFVMAVGVGETEITATTNASPRLSISCRVTVSELEPITLSAMLYDVNGYTSWMEFETNEPANWRTFAAGEVDLYAGALLEGMVYGHNGENLYRFDPDTFETTNLGPISSSWIWSDAAPAPAMEGGYFDRLVGLCNGGTYLEMLNPEEGNLTYFNLSSTFISDPLAAIAYVESGLYDGEYPAAYYYVLTESGELWDFTLYTKDDGKSYSASYTDLGNVGLDLTGVSDVAGGAYASMVYDSTSGYLLLSSYAGESVNRLYAIDLDWMTYAPLGDFGEGNWPVVSLYEYERVTELTVRLRPTHAAVYEKDTLELSGRVPPTAYSNEIIWSSGDESIATVDENGVVTGISEGTVEITATSVDRDALGQNASASCSVTVKPLMDVGAELIAQITDDTGTYWARIDTSDTESPEYLAEAEVELTAGGEHEGKIYGIDGDYQSACSIWMVDPEEDYKAYLGAGCSVSYSFLDVAAAPAMDLSGTSSAGEAIVVDAFNGPLFLSNARTLVYLKDYEKGSIYVTSFDIARKHPDIAALAFLGTTTYGKALKPAQDYLALCADGTLVKYEIYATYNTSEDSIGYTLRQKDVGNVGMKFREDTALSMVYVNDGVNTGLIVAYSDELAELYYIDLTAPVLTIGKLGNVGDATAIAAPYVEGNPPENDAYPYSLGDVVLEGTDTVCSAPISYAEDLDTAMETWDLEEEELDGEVWEVNTDPTFFEAFDFSDNADMAPDSWEPEENLEENSDEKPEENGWVDGEIPAPGNIPSGGLQALKGVVQNNLSAKRVSLQLTEDMDTTNGLLELSYNPAVLTYEGLAACADQQAVSVDAGAGVIRFAYASGGAIRSGNVLATVRFTYAGDSVDIRVTVKTLQRGSNTSVKERPVTIDVTCGGDEHTHTPSRPSQGTEEPATPVTPDIPAVPSVSFLDVAEGAWYYDAVVYMVSNGYMNGVSDAHFDPNGQLSRAMLATLFHRLSGGELAGSANPFTDIPVDAWYARAVNWAAANGILLGTSDTTFSPGQVATREMVVTVLYRYAKADPVAEDHLSAFMDAETVSGWARDAVNWAVAEGYLQGSAGMLNPRGVMTRAEMAQLLMNFLRK